MLRVTGAFVSHHLVLLSLVACVTTAAPAARVEAPAPPQGPPPRALAVRRSDCPLEPDLPRAPSCFAPVDPKHRLVRRQERLVCTLATQPRFVGDAWLSLLLSGVEGNTSFSAPFLRKPSGEAVPLPATLEHPMFVGGALAGLTWAAPGRAFWRDGTCETLDAGPLISVARLGPDEVVGLVETHDRGREVVHRDAQGQWSSWGVVPRGLEPRWSAAEGRVVLHYETHPPTTEFGVLFPDLRRTEVVRRSDSYPAVMPSPAVTPLPRPGSRFSTGAYAELDQASGLLTVDRPTPSRGHHRVTLAKLAPLAGCAGTQPGRHRFRSFSAPAITALDARAVLVALVEQYGECEVELRAAPPPRCAPGQPCRQQPPHLEVTVTQRENQLVLWSLSDTPREVARIPLGAPKDRAFNTVALAVSGEAVYAYAAGMLLQLNRVALGGAR